MKNTGETFAKYCNQGHQYKIIPYRCITCFFHRRKIAKILKDIEERKEFLYMSWDLYLKDRYGLDDLIVRDNEINRLYLEAERLI